MAQYNFKCAVFYHILPNSIQNFFILAFYFPFPLSQSWSHIFQKFTFFKTFINFLVFNLFKISLTDTNRYQNIFSLLYVNIVDLIHL